ncbi:MAG: glycosyltransferase [Candidatus Aenigmarchaeota archaeon]|nr:glycosyltransferase [Candidatus Aenigmarchaeota archaeon]
MSRFDWKKAMKEYGNFDRLDSLPISVVIPVKNERDYIGSSIESVAPYVREVLIVANGSTDGSDIIAKEYESLFNNVKVYKTPGIGVSAARNLGASKSSGEIIYFLDADTLSSRETLNSIYESVGRGSEGGWTRLRADDPDFQSYYDWTNLWGLFGKSATGASMYITRNLLERLESVYGEVFPSHMTKNEDVVAAKRMMKIGRGVRRLNTEAITATDNISKKGIEGAWAERILNGVFSYLGGRIENESTPVKYSFA